MSWSFHSCCVQQWNQDDPGAASRWGSTYPWWAWGRLAPVSSRNQSLLLTSPCLKQQPASQSSPCPQQSQEPKVAPKQNLLKNCVVPQASTWACADTTQDQQVTPLLEKRGPAQNRKGTIWMVADTCVQTLTPHPGGETTRGRLPLHLWFLLFPHKSRQCCLQLPQGRETRHRCTLVWASSLLSPLTPPQPVLCSSKRAQVQLPCCHQSTSHCRHTLSPTVLKNTNLPTARFRTTTVIQGEKSSFSILQSSLWPQV